jgi:16S rRNA (adenine1518-N6/adenine1519-N6)-dimethyltransferase
MPTLIQPKKRYGQNFLVNQAIQSKIIDEFIAIVQEYKKQEIVEIGPGQGDLTKHLIEMHLPLTCLEIDQEVLQFLPYQDWFDPKKINLREADALEVFAQDTDKVLPQDFALFASLPYNVGSRILVEMGLHYNQTPFCVIVQKEVAQKTKLKGKVTFFGLWLNLFWDCKCVFDISAGNFRPSPKVTSTLLIGRPRKTPLIEQLKTLEGRMKVKEIIRRIMAMPNKTVANNLRQWGWDTNKIKSVLEKMDKGDDLRINEDNWLEVIKAVLEVS